MNRLVDTIKFITMALFAIGGLLYFAMNFMVYSYADRMVRQEREYSHPKDPFKGRHLTITENREEDGRRFKRGYLEMTKFNDIKAGRMASFAAYVRIDDLLSPGEARPADEMLPVFVKSRAILYAKQECERLLENFASECAVNHADGRVQEGVIRIDGSMRFVQRDDFGALDPETSWVFANVSDNLTAGAVSTSLSGGAAARAALYRKAAQKCAEIKRRESNCAVTAIRLGASKDRSGGYKLSGAADYSFLVRQEG